MNIQPFSPGPTVTLAATATSADVVIPAGFNVIRVVNAGTGIAFFRTGTSAQTALVTDTPILPSSYEVFTVPQNTTHFAAICAAAGTATIYITVGEGQ